MVEINKQLLIRSLLKHMWTIRERISEMDKERILQGNIRKVNAKAKIRASAQCSVRAGSRAYRNTEGRANLILREVYTLGWRSFYSQSTSNLHKVHIRKCCGLLECQNAQNRPALSEDTLRRCLLRETNELLVCARCTREAGTAVDFAP